MQIIILIFNTDLTPQNTIIKGLLDKVDVEEYSKLHCFKHIAIAGKRDRCVLCRRTKPTQDIRTVIYCKACGVHLCVTIKNNCFDDYHKTMFPDI